ncbi:MAG: methyltransferase domain-containing protein [Deltaproteobacteria bacterium]
MHPRVFEEFERICRTRGAGGDVLEIGAVPSRESLLFLPALSGARSRIGVDLAGDAEFEGVRIVGADANDLCGFGDASFDTVLCNSVLEHDPEFWRTLREIRRVARPGALVAIGVPGFDREPPGGLLRGLARRPLLGGPLRRAMPSLLASTSTLVVHDFPGDYYRFSPQAVREVFLAGLAAPEVVRVLAPPRIVGAGLVPRPARGIPA